MKPGRWFQCFDEHKEHSKVDGQMDGSMGGWLNEWRGMDTCLEGQVKEKKCMHKWLGRWISG